MIDRTDSDRDLQRYLHDHIPISAAMGVTVATASTAGVTLHAPLDVNINHRATVFGGSASAVAILAGWAMLHVLVRHGARGDRIVIQRSTIDYVLPIEGDFEAVARPPAADEWTKFQKMVARKGMGRVDLTIELRCRGAVVGESTGTYVVLTE